MVMSQPKHFRVGPSKRTVSAVVDVFIARLVRAFGGKKKLDVDGIVLSLFTHLHVFPNMHAVIFPLECKDSFENLVTLSLQ